jgi:hypothetical protein
MENSEGTKVPGSMPLTSHLDTRHLRWASVFASLIAFCNRRDELFPSDLLAGIYVANLERVSKFWLNPDLFEELVAEHCDWSEPRWLTWQRWQVETAKAASRWRLPFGIRVFTVGRRSKNFYGARFRLSPDWNRLFETGEKLTPHKVSWQGKSLPLLTPEVMLLALVRTENMLLGKHLEETGLLVGTLEDSAIRHIDNPEKLMF